MAKFINTINSNLLFNIKRLNSLIENSFIINHVSLSSYQLRKFNISHLEDNQSIPARAVSLKAQFQKLQDSNTYQITIFNSYGKKGNTTAYKNKRDFKKAFIRYASRKLFPHRFNKFGKIKNYIKHTDKEQTYENVLSYHKQGVSKKSTSNTFVSNEKDLKMEVYKWLLKKNKEAVVIPEFSVGNRRADYISFDTKKINCTIVEIKSELDTFDRLAPQLEAYSFIANSVYLAIDKKQYDKLLSKNINIPKHIGILVFDNLRKIKLYEVKKVSKNEYIINNYFISYLSYLDINNSFIGFKYSSKLSKEQKEKFIEQCIKKNALNRFAYDIVCNRHIKESDIRKELFKLGNIEKSVASSKELNINRFDLVGKYQITLSNYIKDKNVIYKYFIEQENKLLKEFKDILNFKDYIKSGSESLDNLVAYLKNQKNSFHINGLTNTSFSFLKKSFPKIGNQLDFLESLAKNKDEVIKYIKATKKEQK